MVRLADVFGAHGPFCDLLCAYLSGAAEPGPRIVLSWAPDGRIRAENEIFTGSDLNFGYEYEFIGIAPPESRYLSQGLAPYDEWHPVEQERWTSCHFRGSRSPFFHTHPQRGE
jgi:hypothetical protein